MFNVENGKIFCRNAKNGKIFYNDVGPQRQSGLHINKPPTHRSQLRPKKNKNILKYSVCCQIRFKNLKNRPCGAQGHDAHSIHTIFRQDSDEKGPRNRAFTTEIHSQARISSFFFHLFLKTKSPIHKTPLADFVTPTAGEEKKRTL